MIFGVIMAGGGGTRFWPLSTEDNPKQLLNLSGKNAMINQTLERLFPVTDRQSLYVVTNKTQAKKLQGIAGDRLNPKNILIEPARRNTAACIGYAAAHILKTRGDGVMIVSPSDAYIKDELTYAKTLRLGAEYAQNNDCIVTVGITPTFAATGYGYIKFTKSDLPVKKAQGFVEKPSEEVAKTYLDSGDYVWNSGVFIFKASVIMERIKEFLPELYKGLTQIYEAIGGKEETQALEKIYPALQSISIDYGVMERARDIYVIPASFGWNDVGSWDMLGVLHDADQSGNILVGDALAIDSKNTTLFSSGRTVAVVGVDNLVVVETPTAVLVCPKDKAQDVKKIVDTLKERGRTDLL